MRTIIALSALLVLPLLVHASTLPPGFQESEIASGTLAPIALELAPDGRFFVCEQGGNVRVIKNGALLGAPLLQLTVDYNGQHGLQSIALDPAFSANGYFYIVYTPVASPTHNVLSRFTASGDTADPNSEIQLFQFDAFSGNANFGVTSLAMGPDGKLYVGAGDNGGDSETSPNAQSMTSTWGKVLRLNTDGSIPSDNPFYNSASGNYRAIWALGLRNPYTLSFQPGTGRLFINDVNSQMWEEINDGVAGSNYGFPNVRGNGTDPQYTNPLYCYPYGRGTTATGCAITGGAFYNPPQNQFPDNYAGSYFFMDYVNGWINRIDLNNANAVSNFASTLPSDVVHLKVGADGSLYYIYRGTGALRCIQYFAPILTSQPQSQTIAAGSSATFSVTVRAAASFTCQWLVNGTVIPNATALSYTTPPAAGSDNGSIYSVMISNANGTVTGSATLTVQAPPVITTPPSATPNPANIGDTVSFLAGATDSDGETLGYAWDFGDGSSGTGSTTTHVYAATGVYAIGLTVTDSNNQSVNSAGLAVTVSATPVPQPPGSQPPGAQPPSSQPASTGPQTLTISSIKGSVNFKTAGHDALTLKGTIPNMPASLDPSGQTLVVNASSAMVPFVLNSKGQGHSNQGVFSMNLRTKPGRNATFSIRLKNGAWSALWGIDTTTSNASFNFAVELQLNASAYLANVPMKYSKSTSGGTLKN